MVAYGSIVKTLAVVCYATGGASAQAFRFYRAGINDDGICRGARQAHVYTGTKPNICTNFPTLVAAVSPEYIIPGAGTGIVVYTGRNCKGKSLKIPNNLPLSLCSDDKEAWASVSYGFSANGRRDGYEANDYYNETAEGLDRRNSVGYQEISTDPSAWDYWNGQSGGSDQWVNAGNVVPSRPNAGLARDMADAIANVWTALDEVGVADNMVGSFSKNVDTKAVAMSVQTAMLGGKTIRMNSLKFLIADQLTWNKIQRKCGQLVIPLVVAGVTIGTVTIFGF
ncbi:hypothetical protein NQ176_g2777 [Zarea fungicola]|uniref:Uncharacterized protein n=1 Tax=Zarea fungicola TaxID=93591 RepID=A0ACC1NMS5_9HYPO|nr:hypothetical protein NQ176_g2777 [Lecanicillium fungicola]